MSTTVTYKGDTLTTVSNATKTLKTAGKYMEDDVVITDILSGGGDTYTLTTVVPQQTFTAQVFDNSYQNTVTYTAGLEDGESYLVTFDGEQYLCDCGVMWGHDYMSGTLALLWDRTANDVYPFGLDYVPSAPEFGVGVADTNQHTIKVEHIEFVDGPLNLIAKSVTANGTYSASSDNADGYSSVTVNVSGGMDMPVFTVVMDSEWTTVQSVTCSMTFAECTSYVNDNDTALVEMSAQGDSGTALYSASLYQGNPSELIFVVFLGGIPQANVSIMSNGTCSFTNQPSTVTTLTATANGTYTDSLSRLYSEVTVNVPSGQPTLQAKTATPTTSQQTITADSGYDGLSQVTVSAMPSGTAGTPTATKGSVSNHSIAVTPSVTNTTGYITGSTKTGTAVTVSASELVSGSETKTANGTYDVTNLASLVVDIPIVIYHTSSSAPTSSQGSNGDLWLVTA